MEFSHSPRSLQRLALMVFDLLQFGLARDLATLHVLFQLVVFLE